MQKSVPCKKEGKSTDPTVFQSQDLGQNLSQDLFSSIVVKMSNQTTQINALKAALKVEKERSNKLVEDLEHAIEQLQRLQSTKKAQNNQIPMSILVPGYYRA